MRCYFCASPNTRVVDSRDGEEGAAVRRRRVCEGCGKRFSTFERVVVVPIRVIKRSGRLQNYDLDKIRSAVATACRKRPFGDDVLEELVQQVDQDIRGLETTDVDSKKIGQLILERLKTLDQGAYIRFASVYLQFQSIDEFRQAVDKL